jgi:hypothetical protein
VKHGFLKIATRKIVNFCKNAILWTTGQHKMGCKTIEGMNILAAVLRGDLDLICRAIGHQSSVISHNHFKTTTPVASFVAGVVVLKW